MTGYNSTTSRSGHWYATRGNFLGMTESGTPYTGGGGYAPYAGVSDGSLFPGETVSGHVEEVFGTEPTLSHVMYLSRKENFAAWYNTSGVSDSFVATCKVPISGAAGTMVYPCDSVRIKTDGEYAWNVLVETAAFFFRYSVYNESSSTVLSDVLTEFGSAVAYPPSHTVGDGCQYTDIVSEWRVLGTFSTLPAPLRSIHLCVDACAGGVCSLCRWVTVG